MLLSAFICGKIALLLPFPLFPLRGPCPHKRFHAYTRLLRYEVVEDGYYFFRKPCQSRLCLFYLLILIHWRDDPHKGISAFQPSSFPAFKLSSRPAIKTQNCFIFAMGKEKTYDFFFRFFQ